MSNYIHDFSEFCNSIAASYESMYEGWQRPNIGKMERQAEKHRGFTYGLGSPTAYKRGKDGADPTTVAIRRNNKMGEVMNSPTFDRYQSPKQKRIKEETEDLNEMKIGKMTPSQIKKFDKEIATRTEREARTGSRFSASEKKAIENIGKAGRGDYSWVPNADTKKEVKHESPKAKKRRTSMSDVQVR